MYDTITTARVSMLLRHDRVKQVSKIDYIACFAGAKEVHLFVQSAWKTENDLASLSDPAPLWCATFFYSLFLLCAESNIFVALVLSNADLANEVRVHLKRWTASVVTSIDKEKGTIALAVMPSL
jgi:hypothetical protein